MARQDEVKEKFILAAFVGWQMGAAGEKTFGDYLRRFGLLDEIPKQADSHKEPDAVLVQKREDETLARMGIKPER